MLNFNTNKQNGQQCTYSTIRLRHQRTPEPTIASVETLHTQTPVLHEADKHTTINRRGYTIHIQDSNSFEINKMSSGIEAEMKDKSSINRSSGIKRSLSESSANECNKCGDSTEIQNKMWRNELTLNAHSNRIQPEQRNRSKYIAWSRLRSADVIDIAIRVAMVIFFVHLEARPSFRRKIALEQLWQYKYPRSPDIVTAHALLISVIFCPFLTTILMFLLTRNRRDFRASNWAWTLALCLNGITTSLLKVTVGRPRPDFFARCFPDDGNLSVLSSNPSLLGTASIGVYHFNCTGNLHDVNEGYKSFPSGHSSFAFTSYGFISFYVGSKLHAFTTRGRGETWRLIITILPLVLAGLVAVSRTCDYHHHYEDVIAGAIIGICSTLIAYRQYYPSIFSLNAHVPLTRGDNNNINVFANANNGYKHIPSADEDEGSAGDHLRNGGAESDAKGDFAEEGCLFDYDDKPKNWL